MRELRQKEVKRMKIDGVLRSIQEVDKRIEALYERGQTTESCRLGRDRPDIEWQQVTNQK
jgi:hypothetical protein